MKKLIAGLTITAASLFFASTVSAGVGDSVNAAGGYYQPGYFINVNAVQTQLSGLYAQGWAQNATPNNEGYNAQVKCAKIHGNNAYIAAKLITQNNPSQGPWVYIQLTDNGYPSTQPNGDQVRAEFASQAVALAKCAAKVNPSGGPWNLLIGDIRINNVPNPSPTPSVGD